MKAVIGVVGPLDLITPVISAVSELPGTKFVPYPYTHESGAPDIITAAAAEVDGWLFTGLIPYFISREHLTRPATYAEYSGSTLLTALIQLLRAGHDVTRLSIDSLSGHSVAEALREADVPTSTTRVLEYKPGVTSDEIIRFHREAKSESYVVITCISSVYEALRDEMTCIRLAPSLDAVRIAANELLLVLTNQVNEDSHVVIGLLSAGPQLSLDHPAVMAGAAALSGVLATAATGEILLVTNRAGLHRASRNLTTAPIIDQLVQEDQVAHIGFGTGNSAIEAERLAYHALARAKAHEQSTAVVSYRHEMDLTFGTRPIPDADASDAGAGVAAARAGLSVANIQRLQRFSRAAPGPCTTRDIAEHLDVQMRTARRIVHRLELAGYAVRTGKQPTEAAGRPLTLYQLRL